MGSGQSQSPPPPSEKMSRPAYVAQVRTRVSENSLLDQIDELKRGISRLHYPLGPGAYNLPPLMGGKGVLSTVGSSPAFSLAGRFAPVILPASRPRESVKRKLIRAQHMSTDCVIPGIGENYIAVVDEDPQKPEAKTKAQARLGHTKAAKPVNFYVLKHNLEDIVDCGLDEDQYTIPVRLENHRIPNTKPSCSSSQYDIEPLPGRNHVRILRRGSGVPSVRYSVDHRYRCANFRR